MIKQLKNKLKRPLLQKNVCTCEQLKYGVLSYPVPRCCLEFPLFPTCMISVNWLAFSCSTVLVTDSLNKEMTKRLEKEHKNLPKMRSLAVIVKTGTERRLCTNSTLVNVPIHKQAKWNSMNIASY